MKHLLPFLLLPLASCSQPSDETITASDLAKYELVNRRICHFVNDSWYVETMFATDGRYYVVYGDPDSYDFGDTPEGYLYCTLTLRVDRESYELLEMGAPTTDAMYCDSCKLWHVHFEGFTYED